MLVPTSKSRIILRGNSGIFFFNWLKCRLVKVNITNKQNNYFYLVLIMITMT